MKEALKTVAFVALGVLLYNIADRLFLGKALDKIAHYEEE